ncbi:MAG: AzlD domain-containing protein [Pseudomonadota bacterium]
MDASALSYLTIAAMAVTVYVTRIAGSELMSRIAMTVRLETMLKTMAASVLVAIVVSECARGGTRDSLAVAAAAALMLTTRNPYAAMTAGVGAAATLSFLEV